MSNALVAVAHGPMRLRGRDERTAVLHPAGPVLEQTIGWAHQPLPRRRSLAYVVLDCEVEAPPGMYLCGGDGGLKLLGLVRPGHAVRGNGCPDSWLVFLPTLRRRFETPTTGPWCQLLDDHRPFISAAVPTAKWG